MATDVSFSNVFMAYWSNSPYNYKVSGAGRDHTRPTGTPINTGWHILPLTLWKHFTTAKQWAELVINYEAYTVKGFTCTVYNPVPMTQQLAIQGTTTFTAFNNTIYSLGVKDELYETSWYNWNDPAGTGGFNNFSLAYKEGYYLDNPRATNQKRTLLPVYYWRSPTPELNSTVTWTWDQEYNSTSANLIGNVAWPITGTNTISLPDGVFWDPLTSPDDIMELRPGKNSMTWSWERHDCDENKWYNIDQLARWAPYTADMPWVNLGRIGGGGAYQPDDIEDPKSLSGPRYGTNPATEDYTIPNLANMPIVPVAWWWIEMQKSIVGTFDDNSSPQKEEALYGPGTEYEQYKYPPTQCFIKGLPLFDDDGNHISTTTQGCFKVTLHLAAKKRRSRIYAPTWHPYTWRFTHTIQAPRVGSYVRYRTGGARRTWTNLRAGPGLNGTIRVRSTPYNTNSTYATSATTRTTSTTSTRMNY